MEKITSEVSLETPFHLWLFEVRKRVLYRGNPYRLSYFYTIVVGCTALFVRSNCTDAFPPTS